ncbi:MAG: helix-turn-helix transcriptional regulator [Planctomycetes bacterium]|nr:helix-turn-helix transcriptional regulator [Planctomycetota bacterium]
MGARIRAARESRKWSQRQLASAIGRSKVSVTTYESARVCPSVATLVALAKALDRSLDWLAMGRPRRWVHGKWAGGGGRLP